MWDKWLEAKKKNEAPAKTLKAYVKKALSEQLQGREAALENHAGDNIKISTIFFAYANGEIIKMLKKRGNLVFKQKLEKVLAMEHEIDALAEAHADKFERPVACFVTFNTQEGYERCINHFETQKTAFGYPIYRKDMKETKASVQKVEGTDEESKAKL